MLKSHHHQLHHSSILLSYNSSLSSHARNPVSLWPKTTTIDLAKTKGKSCSSGVGVNGGVATNIGRGRSSVIRASLLTDWYKTTVKVKGVVTVKLTVAGTVSSALNLTGALDVVGDLVGQSLDLELVSSQLDPTTGSEKETVKGYGYIVIPKDLDEVEFECAFNVPEDFGEVGAVLVQNKHANEMLLEDIVLNGLSNDPITITCNSWIASILYDPKKRIFFTNKSFLPSSTPNGLKKLREEELNNLRGNGKGERKGYERIYDYDVYNDLGNPDLSDKLARPVLGGEQHPYPRRCRTGRGPTTKDPMSEQRSIDVYVPRDEAFSEKKFVQFAGKSVKEVLHAVVPSIESLLVDSKLGFPNFKAIDNLFDEGFTSPALKDQGLLRTLVPRMFKVVSDGADELLRFDTPEMLDRDKFSWLRDEEFSRQTLAGLNPYSIQLVTEWPLKSKLDPSIYGPAESLITKEIVEQEIKGIMTVDEALEQKRLFMLDYHDLLLPYVKKVRELEGGAALYGSRTLFFLTNESTLRPIAIELTRPPMGDNKPLWRQVFTPGSESYDATNCWLWTFAKVHVCVHDSGYHELVSHWLRTHCCIEPYIIATNRQLSAMHPIYRLLHPHLRYTMEINALARAALISAGGIIESTFSPGKYSIELSSAAYDQLWRFDMEGLPADLIRRGMAVEDPKAQHGLKLTVKDYPFANDGLLIWDSIKTWVTDYVNYYYPQPNLVQTDAELQAWWTEIRTKGHQDKKDESWWPLLNTPDDLIGILTTIIWVASCHHAAVNFGQYTYGGYFPNRPSIARTNMPNEDTNDESYKMFLKKPELELMKCFPSQIQATVVMAILSSLSSHSSDEEYLGDQIQPSWSENPIVKAAFERFSGRLKEVEGIIDARNEDPNLKNRSGAGVVPYELLKPLSSPGVTGKGVPNSISI